MAWTRRTIVGGLAATILTPARAASPAAAPSDGFIALEAAPAKLRLLPAPTPETDVWAYGGQVPGPLLRVRLGQEVKVRLVNKLAQPTSLCWHGVRIANAMDGVAGLTQKPVAPGESFDYRFTPPDAGFYWYHPHVFPQSAEQIGRGLYGLLVVDEASPPAVDQELFVVIDDWSLDAQGKIDGNFLDKAVAAADGRIGKAVTVNGQAAPSTPVQAKAGARVRIRILNACAARIAIVSLIGMEATIVAIDGQASEIFPAAGNTLPIGPGSRFEVIADLPGDAAKAPSIVLRKGLAHDADAADRPLLTFALQGKGGPAKPRPGRLPENPLLPSRIPLEKSVKKTLVIGGGAGATPSPAAPWLWTLDGAGSDGLAARPLFSVKRGGAVTLAFANKTAFAQQMHVHGHVFRVLHDLDDGWDPYWRESILVAPGKTKHVAFIADNPGKWAVESLILDRQVTGLAGWFEVT